MTQAVTAEAALANLLAQATDGPSQIDVWINNSNNRYIIAVHNDHKGGSQVYMREMPDGTRMPERGGPSLRAVLKFEPHSETQVPRAYRQDIQVVQCRDPECQANPATRGRCVKDHPGVVFGGKCPSLRRKGTEKTIVIPDVFNASLVEVQHIGLDGRKSYTLEHPEDLLGEKAALQQASQERAAREVARQEASQAEAAKLAPFNVREEDE